MSMRRIALETYRTGEEYARLQKEKDEIRRKREIEAFYNEVSKLLKDMCAKTVKLLHRSSIDSYATSVPDVIYLQVDDELEFKALRKKDKIELSVLSGGVYKQFNDLTELGRILHEDTGGQG
jgi:hypothetical protein